MASGGLAGALSLCFVYPLDYARTRLASDVGGGKKQFNGLSDCLIKTSSGPKGPLGLYNGFGVSVVGIIPFRGTYFGVNDTLNDFNPYQKERSLRGLASKFACAQTAAISAGYASYPFDTVRRRMMLQSEKPKADRLYKGSFDCFFKVLQKEGLKGMYKGLLPEMFRGVGGSLVIVIYDRIKVIFNM